MRDLLRILPLVAQVMPTPDSVLSDHCYHSSGLARHDRMMCTWKGHPSTSVSSPRRRRTS